MPEVRNISNKFKIKIFVIKWTILWTSVLILWATLNPYLRDFGNVRERHFWGKIQSIVTNSGRGRGRHTTSYIEGAVDAYKSEKERGEHEQEGSRWTRFNEPSEVKHI